jgi:hypothetical protein
MPVPVLESQRLAEPPPVSASSDQRKQSRTRPSHCPGPAGDAHASQIAPICPGVSTGGAVRAVRIRITARCRPFLRATCSSIGL